MNFNEAALKLHEEHHGKIEVASKVPVKTRDDLSTAYTPGVAEPCRKIHDNKKDVYKYTAKGNLVAVVSDGTAVLGLGKPVILQIQVIQSHQLTKFRRQRPAQTIITQIKRCKRHGLLDFSG